MDRTLILVKPDAFERRLTGEIIALKLMTVDEDTAKRHYAEHVGKPFFDPLVAFITSGPMVAMILEGPNAIEAARQLIGSTNGLEASPGSIRGDYALETRRNLVHGSDSPESAEREIEIYFGGGL
jgi:nucleoside-diphosphate kinase